jgi:hypothetical protein
LKRCTHAANVNARTFALVRGRGLKQKFSVGSALWYGFALVRGRGLKQRPACQRQIRSGSPSCGGVD